MATTHPRCCICVIKSRWAWQLQMRTWKDVCLWCALTRTLVKALGAFSEGLCPTLLNTWMRQMWTRLTTWGTLIWRSLDGSQPSLWMRWPLGATSCWARIQNTAPWCLTFRMFQCSPINFSIWFDDYSSLSISWKVWSSFALLRWLEMVWLGVFEGKWGWKFEKWVHILLKTNAINNWVKFRCCQEAWEQTRRHANGSQAGPDLVRHSFAPGKQDASWYSAFWFCYFHFSQ